MNHYEKILQDHPACEREFDEFYQGHKKILIYGTEEISRVLTQYFNRRKLKFEFYCVTKREKEKLNKVWMKNIDSIKVFDEIKHAIDDSYGIVLVMDESNANRVTEYLRSRKVLNNIFFRPEFISYIRFYDFWEDSNKVILDNDSVRTIGNYNLREDTFYIACPAHIGDTLYVASLVNAFKHEHGVDRVCLIVQNCHRDIPDFFHSIDEKLVSDELVRLCASFSIFKGVWKCRNYLYGHFKKYLVYFPFHISYYPELNFKSKFVSNYKRHVMCVDEKSELEKMEIKGENSLENNHNSVILMPHSYSCPTIPNNFWEKLAKQLVEYGYAVYTNVKDETEYVIDGTHALSKSLADIPVFAEKSSLVIALRSGICDLLALTETKMILIVREECAYYQSGEFDDIADNVKEVLFDSRLSDEENVMTVLRSANLPLVRQS